jgi:hypothetical protein
MENRVCCSCTSRPGKYPDANHDRGCIYSRLQSIQTMLEVLVEDAKRRGVAT